ncbi:MAG: carboxypeptidase regulatory-like domain-containing protein [Bryobacterales bacterium]|nr:carboxypeptidase regulatory-like domain-containing protein [Bryobacterales bacterium]
MRLRSLTGTLVLCLLLPWDSAFAQVFTGTISGTVTDPNAASIPAATVRARNEATNDVRSVQTSGDGLYVLSQLPPGNYEVSVEMQGFRKSVQSAVTLRVNQTLEVNFKLELGEVSQVVEVTGGVTMLDTQSANRSVTLDQQAVLDLPVNARNPFVLVHVNAGVIAVRTGISQATQDQNHNRFSMNGGRGQAGLTLIDGVPASAVDWGGLIASPSVDSVQEVSISRNQFDAQFGKSDGGAVNMITRGGSNDFHGALFEFLRNDKLDANSWANNRSGLKRVLFQRNQFGATLGGPIWKSKRLYFFGAYEGLRQGSPGTNISSVPTDLQRAGNFSQTFNANGTQATIYNPFTTRPNPSGSGFIRDPFPGNVIPSNLIDPVAAKVMSFYPRPNTQGDPFTNARNFVATGKTTTINDRMDARIDWAKNEKWTMFGRFTKAWQENVAPVFFGNGADTNFSDVNPRHQLVFGNTITPTPTWVINILFGSGRWRENQNSPSTGLNATNLGFSQALVSQFQTATYPGFAAQGYTSLFNRRFLNVPRETHNLQVNLTKELGSHSLKFGWIGELARLNNTDFNTPEFSFTRGLTSGPVAAVASTVTGDGIASLLLGTGASGSAPIGAATAVTSKYYGAYIQDSWRVNRRLTMHLGLRWEAQLGRTERFNRLNNFDYQVESPLARQTGLPLKGGLVFVQPGQGAWNTTWANFAPRIGMAYKVTDKLVVRGGYGIFYPQTGGGTNQGFATTTTWVSTVGGDGINPNTGALLRNPFPQGFTQPAGSSLGLLTQVGDSVNAFSRHHPLSYVQNFSFDFQYELAKNMVLEVGYTGSQGRKLLFGTGQQANQLHPSQLGLGASLNDAVPNPFRGVIATGVLAGATVPRHRLLRPYPQFTAVNVSGDTPGASSSFNALVVRYNWQISGQLNLLTTYQWSKAIDNASEWQGWEVGDTMRDYYNLQVDRSISAHDIPQSFVNALVYEMPIGKGRKYLADINPVANAIIGGWQVSTIIRFSHGLPLGFTAPNTLSAYGFQVQRPNVADLKTAAVSNPTPDQWFNQAAFVAPGQYEMGNLTRWTPNIRFGPTNHADLAILKNFRWGERWKAQFRAEMFNMTNTPQFGRANTTVGSGDFGKVSGTTNVGPRNVQLGLRVQF